MTLIAEYGYLFIILAVVFGLFMTWGIGANDVANALGTSVGSGAIKIRTAIIIAAIFEFAGAAIAGSHVTKTIRKGIIDPTPFTNNPELLVLGMMAALLAAATWLAIASTKGWPVSTTHSIIGALVGFAIAAVGLDAVQWGQIAQIVASWVVSPLLGGVIAFVLMISIQRFILNADEPLRRAIQWGPFYVFLVGFIIALVTLFKGLKHFKLDVGLSESVVLAAALGAIAALIGWRLIRNVTVDPAIERDFHFAAVEKVFAPLIVFTACAMAFAHGSNDVANGIGPLAGIYSLVHSGGALEQNAPVPAWILLLGGGGIVIGLATYGYKVMQTIGTRITDLTPTRGFCATMGAAVTVVIASRTALPVSTTHIAVGAVMGVGLARGIAAINMLVIRDIIVSWLVTLPAGGLLAALFYLALKAVFI